MAQSYRQVGVFQAAERVQSLGNDQQTARLTALRWPLHYHLPSLVQHTGRLSTWGDGPFHYARDFEEDWAPG